MTAALFLTDEELADMLHIPKRDLKAVLTVWSRAGFPPPDTQIGMRYLPAVRAWLDRRHHVGREFAQVGQDGEEVW